MARAGLVVVPDDHAWLFDLLVNGSPVPARPGTDGVGPAAWAASGRLPPGFERAERFALIPGAGGRSFAVSLASAAGSAAALTSYNALRSPAKRAARRVLGLGLRSGAIQPLLARKVDVGHRPAAAGAAAGEAVSLISHLCELFGVPRIVLAAGAGAGPYRKPVLQAFTTGGAPLGYVKVGWNDWTVAAVRREADALLSCQDRQAGFGVPGVIARTAWRGLELLVTEPLPARVRRVGARGGRPGAGLIRQISELSAVRSGPLAADPWWRDLRARIESAASDRAARDHLEGLADLIEDRHGGAELRYGAWHGDLVPWNQARLGGRRYLWDWESSAPYAPVGFDALHYHFQVAFVARRRSLPVAAGHAVRLATPTLTALGIPPAGHRALADLHLMELLVRHEEARASTGDLDPRFWPAVTGVLRASLRGAAGSGTMAPPAGEAGRAA